MDVFQAALSESRTHFTQLDEDMRDRQAIADRVLECYRTNDLLRIMVERKLDLTIGESVTVDPRPDWRALGVDEADAIRWSEAVKCAFDAYAHCPENWISANRQESLTGLVRGSERTRYLTGESLTLREWRPSPLGFNTCFQQANPRRLATPPGTQSGKIYHGIEFDRYSAPTAYHFQYARPDQRRSFGNKRSQRITKYNRFGWLQVFHSFQSVMPEYPRGISPYCAILPKLEQRDQASRAILDKEILAATIALIISSDDDPEKIAEMMAEVERSLSDRSEASDDPEFEKAKSEILQTMLKGRKERMGGSVWLQLFGGEEATSVQSNQQTGNTAEFLAGYTKPIANGAGLSYEMATGDFKGLNFSGGQLSTGLTEFSIGVERKSFTHRTIKLMYRAFLDEFILVRNRDSLLNGIPYGGINREHYARCSIPGVRRVSVDPLKDKKTAVLALSGGLASRSEIIAASGGNFNDTVEARTKDALSMLDAVESAAQTRSITMSQADKFQILVRAIMQERVDIDFTQDEPEASDAGTV